MLTAENAFLARSYVKSEPGTLCSKIKISISDAYFSTVETVGDFFNRIGRLQPIAREDNDGGYRRKNLRIFTSHPFAIHG